MTSIPYTNAVAPASERRTISIAVVAALHLAVIYTILAALDIVPSPLPTHDITAWIIPEKKVVVVTPPPPTDPRPRGFVRPTNNSPLPPNPGDHPTTGQEIFTPPGANPVDTFTSASSVPGTHTIPAFPPLDRRLSHEGTVQLTIAIDADGNVTGASIDRSSGYDSLDAAAIAWVKDHWRYRPAMHNGVAVASSTKASVVFQLTQTGN
ncbi:MAG TPA: TonB family protein [Rhizomicrobium sp.]|jgi:protein TonB|nr:TonB family protein [Rhizomicrobium sp.]